MGILGLAFAHSVHAALDHPVGEPSFGTAVAGGGQYSYASTASWIQSGTGNWFYNTAYATDTSPKRPLPRTGNVALHGISQYTSQVLTDTFVAGRTYTFSIYLSGDGDSTGDSDRTWLYLYDGTTIPGPFSEGLDLVRARWISSGVDSLTQSTGTGAASVTSEGWSIGVNGAGDWVTGGGTWGLATLSYTATAAEDGHPIGIAIWGAGDAAWDDVTVTSDLITSAPPVITAQPAGPATADAGVSNNFDFLATDPEGDDVEIQADWGNGVFSAWTAAGPSGVTQTIAYSYPGGGNLTIRARSRDSNGAVSDWIDIQFISVNSLPPTARSLVGLWEFNNAANLGEATIGNDLVVGGTLHTHYPDLADDLGNSQTGAITTEGGLESYFTANHDIPANGGGAEVNQYSFVIDLFSPPASRDIWRAVYAVSPGPNDDDAEYWIAPGNTIGVGDIGYSAGPIDQTAWTRLVVTVDLAQTGTDFVTYLNGALHNAHTVDQAVDGRHGLLPAGGLNVVHFLGDNTAEENPPMNVSTIALYQGVLSPIDVAALGGAGGSFVLPDPVELTWTGATSSEWSTNVLGSPKNWVNTGDASENDFEEFDLVLFDDTAASGIVEISNGDVSPSSVTVNNSALAFTLSGLNGIAGGGGLTKGGSGTLNLNSANSFSGTTALNAGILALGDPLALERSPLNIAGGATLDFGALTATTTGGLSGAGNLHLENTAGPPAPVNLTVNGSGSYTGILSGPGSLTKGGGGQLVLGSASTFSLGSTIAGGLLRIDDPAGLGAGSVNIAGGTMVFSFGDGSTSTVANDFVLPATGQNAFFVQGNAGGAPSTPTVVELSGLISGGSPGAVFRFCDTNYGGVHWDVLIPSNPSNSFEGTIEMWRGTLGIMSDAVLGNPDNDIKHVTENLNGAIRFDADGITLNALRDIDFTTDFDTNIRPINTQGFNATIAGNILGQGILVKQGSGTLTLTGSTFFAGAVEVAEGTVALAGAADFGSVNDLNIVAGAVLDVSAISPFFSIPTLRGEGEVSGDVFAVGTIAPGTAAGALGTLTLDGLDLDGFLEIEFESIFGDSDRLVVDGDLSFEAFNELVPTDIAGVPAALPAGTKIAIIEYTGTWNGSVFNFFGGGFFDPLPDGATLTVGPNTFVIDYDDTTDGVNVGQFVTLTVFEGSAFDSWTTRQGLDGSPGAEAGFGDSPDGGALENGLEWILGGDPSDETDDGSLIGHAGDATNGLTLTFTRAEDSLGEATLLVQWNSDLGGSWIDVPVGAASSGPDANGVTVTVNDLANPDEITVNIPAANAAEGKIFARLHATAP
ncbi:MAG: autotransporter-associated beta strand repeat-containing protein [Roseibacillus sp.]|nr:autotransporter-associated beta strand repeat-containing protein [Roseibacillus sp.]